MPLQISKGRPRALIGLAFIACLFSIIWFVYWLYLIIIGQYFGFPAILQAFFVMDVFFLVPIYFFSSLGILLGRKDMEIAAMMSGLGIFTIRVTFLLASLIESFAPFNLGWFFNFLFMPLQAWLFTLYLGRRFEVVEWRISGKRWWERVSK